MSGDPVLSLRIELKTWEKQFAAENGGKRPGREDIKNNATIAAKYREYDRLRRPVKKPEPRGDKPAKILQSTPKKKTAPAATPQKPNSQFLVPALPEEHREEELEPTPAAVRIRLGPTPQKDGQILSLFDDLPSITSTRKQTSRSALATIQANVSTTPSKPSQQLFNQDGSTPPDNLHLNHTPASSSKRFLLDSFVSTPPLKRKREDEDTTVHAAPSSSTKGLSTPAFLRRSSNMLIMDSLAEEAENDEEYKSLNMGRPLKKRGIVRSLSSIIQGLRKQEDDRLDEEMDMMNELEDGNEPAEHNPAVQVEDSQVIMPLGPDRAQESDEEEEEEQTGVSRKPWKKKGLKRQTKRVIMRPVAKPKAQTQEQPSQTLFDEENPDEESAVAETQLANAVDHPDSDSDAEYSDTEAKRKRQLSKTTTADTSKTTKGDNVVKKAARKISATAHANFRRLNIKNQNSKAKGRGRFGRR